MCAYFTPFTSSPWIGTVIIIAFSTAATIGRAGYGGSPELRATPPTVSVVSIVSLVQPRYSPFRCLSSV